MVRTRSNYLAIMAVLLCNATVWAQENSARVEMADTMRSSGKIYVVVAVCLTILFGLILYLIRLDRKISKLEKEN